MNRRGFLARVFAAPVIAAALALSSPVRKRGVAIPTIRLNNTLITPAWVTREVLRAMKGNLAFTSQINARLTADFNG